MFFFVSKIIAALLVPWYWIVSLLVWRFFAKSPMLKRRLEIFTLLLIFLFSNKAIYNSIMFAWQPQPVTLPAGTTYSAGIVLGGYESFDQYGNGYFNGSSDRFIQTLKLYHQKKIKKIVASGSHVINGEAQPTTFVKNEFIAMGVQPADVLFDDKSRTTFENAVFSGKLLGQIGLQPPYLLITSAQHMPRALLVFKKAGLAVLPFPCNYEVRSETFKWYEYLLPSGTVLQEWPYLLKELAGIVGYRLFNRA